LFFWDSPPIIDPAWPHLSQVYEILTRLAQSIPSHEYFSGRLFRKLLIPSESPDANERNAIRDFFAALFRGANHLRSTLVSLYEFVLLDYCYSHKHSPFLICTILSVFFYIVEHTVPLLQSSDRVFVRGVLPLIGDRAMLVFAPALEQLFTFFFEERPSHAATALSTIISVFPRANTQRQMKLLELITVILDQPHKYHTDLAMPLAVMLARASETENESIAQKALRMWGKAGIDRVLGDQRRVVLPVIAPMINRAMNHHWSFSVRQAAKAALTMFQRRDGRILRECALESASMPVGGQPLELKQWIAVAKTAYSRDSELNISMKMQAIVAEFKSTDIVRPKMPAIGMPRADSERARALIVPRPLGSASRPM
jgi:serine/threonine-protein phosphatase 2A regulatory subunit B'